MFSSVPSTRDRRRPCPTRPCLRPRSAPSTRRRIGVVDRHLLHRALRSAPGLILPVIVLAVPVDDRAAGASGCPSAPTARSTALSADGRTAPTPTTRQRRAGAQSTRRMKRNRERLTIPPYRVPRAGFCPGCWTRAEDRLTEIVRQAIQILVVLLADVLGQLAALVARERPTPS